MLTRLLKVSLIGIIFIFTVCFSSFAQCPPGFESCGKGCCESEGWKCCPFIDEATHCCSNDEICCMGFCCSKFQTCVDSTVYPGGKQCVSPPYQDDPSCCASESIYGEDSEEVKLLRKYRDEVLSKTPEGRKIIRTYYQWSPVIIDLLEKDELLREYVMRLSYKWGPSIIKAMEEDEVFKEQVKEIVGGMLMLITKEAN